MWFHIGANKNQRERVYIGTMTAQAFKFSDGTGKIAVSLSAPGGANDAIGVMDDALQKLAKQRADLGAYYNRLEMTAKGLMTAYENMQASESRIRDADMAEEMVEFLKKPDPRSYRYCNARSGEYPGSVSIKIARCLTVPKQISRVKIQRFFENSARFSSLR